jgi:hypothetical protein
MLNWAAASGAVIEGRFEPERINPNWIRLTAVLANTGNTSIDVDMVLFLNGRAGSDADYMQSSIQAEEQVVLPLIGPRWTLNMLRRPFGALDATPIDGFWPGETRVFYDVSIPYSGRSTYGTSISWLNRTVAPGAEARVVMIFGLGDAPIALPPMPTPVPTPGFRGQRGNTTIAFNLFWEGERTTYMESGWKTTMYQTGTVTTVPFRGGTAKLGDVTGIVGFEQFTRNYTTIFWNLTNSGTRDQAVDIVPYADTWIGGTDMVRIGVFERNQPVINFPGQSWTLTWFPRPIPGIVVTPVSGWYPGYQGDNRYHISTPFEGICDGFQFHFLNVTVPAGQTVTLRTMMGVGDPGVTTPSPPPQPIYATLYAQDGNRTIYGDWAFNLRRLGQGTTVNDVGWKAVVRRSDSTGEYAYVAGGVGKLRDVEVDMRYEQVSDTYVRIVFQLINTGVTRPTVDILLTGEPYLGGSVDVSLMNRKQPVITLQGPSWNLGFIVQPIAGADVTGVDRFQPFLESWESVGAPFTGKAVRGVSFSWLNKRIPLAGSTEVSLIVGYGSGLSLPPTPTPYPEFPLMVTEGNTSHFMNVRYLGEPSTTSDFGWTAVLRNATHNVHFSNGEAVLGTVVATTRFEQINERWVRPVITLQNPSETSSLVDVLFGGSIRLGPSAPQHAFMSYTSLDQDAVVLEGDHGWNLTVITRPFPGADVTPLSGFSILANSFHEASLPYSGRPTYRNFLWLRQLVPAGGSIELATILGVGAAPFQIPPAQTPRATPYPLEVTLKSGLAFQMRYLGQETTEEDSGWRGILRSAGSFEESIFSNGAAYYENMAAHMRVEHLSPSYVQVTTMLTHVGDSPDFADVMLWAPLRLGSDASIATMSVPTRSYSTVSFVGLNWTLNAVVGPLSGVQDSNCTGIYPGKASWWDLPVPFSGPAPWISFSWQNVSVAPGPSKALSLVFGVGNPPFAIGTPPSPVPTAAPLSLESGRDGTAFNIRWNGQKTSFMNVGWQGRIRTTRGRVESLFSYGRAQVAGLTASVELEQISPNWGRVTFQVANGAIGERFDLQLWTLPRMGEDAERPHVVIVNASQGVTKFIGEAYTLNMVTRPADGVASSVTPPTRFDVVMGSWAQVSTPYSGNPGAMTWTWMDVPVTTSGNARLSVILGVGDAGFPTPVPLPQPRTYTLMGQPGNATYAFNLRHLSQQTTARGEGWGGLLRQAGQTTEAYFSNGVARLADLTASVRFVQIFDAAVQMIFTINNPRQSVVDIDLLFSCQTAATSVTMAVMRQGIFHFEGWDLTLVRYPLNGAPVDVLDRWFPAQDSWEAASTYVGAVDGISFSWTGRRVPAGGSLELKAVFAIDLPTWPSPPASATRTRTPTRTPSPTRSVLRTEAPQLPDATALVAVAKRVVPTGAIAGIVVSIVVVVVVAIVAIGCVRRRAPHDEIQDELVGEGALQSLYT